MRDMTCVLFLSILITLVASASWKCKDCINIRDCPAVSNYLRPNVPEKDQKLRDAFCGFDYQGSKVCCSQFEVAPSTEVDEIEAHPNVKMLPDNCGYINGDRIYGGTVASLYEFPWMALISYRIDAGFAFQCAGSVINDRYIITAAHCIMGQDIAGVRIGDFDIRYDHDCQKSLNGRAICESHIQDIRIEETVYHPKYEGPPKYAFDIGLIRLQKPVDFSHKNAAPICLPLTKSLRNAALANKIATVAGWGLTENQMESSVLLKVDVPIHPDVKCIDIYSRILQPSDPETGSGQFCAGSHHKDTCNGDSGAPLMIEDKYNGVSKIIQYGIVSQGRLQCGSDTPAVYTAVSPYVKWILDNIKP